MSHSYRSHSGTRVLRLHSSDCRTRKEHAERRSSTGTIFDPRASVVELGESLDERQTDADAAPGFGSLTEGLEQRRRESHDASAPPPDQGDGQR
jgi:hypothetical protein